MTQAQILKARVMACQMSSSEALQAQHVKLPQIPHASNRYRYIYATLHILLGACARGCLQLAMQRAIWICVITPGVDCGHQLACIRTNFLCALKLAQYFKASAVVRF